MASKDKDAPRPDVDDAVDTIDKDPVARPATLVEALARAQARFPRIEKNQTGEVRGTNKQGQAYSYTYKYADLGEILSAVRPVIAEEGIALVQRLETDERGKVNLLTELRGYGEVLDSKVELGQSTSNPQQFGGALTYLRRYCAGTILGVAAEQDLDAQEVEPSRPAPEGATPPLPPWATDLSNGALKVLGERLKVIVGDDEARDAARTIKSNLGGIPAIVNMTAGLVLDKLLDSNPDELLVRLDAERRRRAQEAAQAEAAAADAQAKREAEEAAARAEAPDPPAPEPDVPADTEGLVTTPPPAAADDLPPAGSIDPPDASGLAPLEAVGAYREAGCVCDDPLATDDSFKPECPVKGHGIPF